MRITGTVTTEVSEVFLNDTDPRIAMQIFRERNPQATPTLFNGEEIEGVCEGCGKILIAPNSGGSDSDGVRFCDLCIDEIKNAYGGLIDEDDTTEFIEE